MTQGTTKEAERTNILNWFKKLPDSSYGIATMHTNISGFFPSGGTRLLTAYSSQSGNYGGIFILPYWKTEAPSFATVENGELSNPKPLAFLENLNNIIRFSGNASSINVRSGDSELKNIYLDISDGSGNVTSILFASDSENVIKLIKNGKVIWTK